ncbi:MAG TPA: DUF937 domain-containing protein [Crenotrichaceae bacterium]|nr:DUF937 domain-containing protein [Crenotrichaceae bacterium]
MSFNLIDVIKDQLSEQVLDQVGSLLGGDSNQLSSAVGSAIPGLLSGLINLGADATSANAMVSAINNQDDSILDNLGDLLSSKESQESLLESGSSLLSSLLGNNALGNLASAISGFSGLGSNSSKSLLGLIAPVVFSVIKRKLIGSGGLNVNSLMDMFNGQKDNIVAAMPAGFKQQLKSSGFMGDFSETLNDATENLSDVAEQATSSGAAWLSRLIPLVIFLGVIWFAYNQFLKSEIEIPEIKSEPVVDNSVELQTKAIKPAAVRTTGSVRPVSNVKEELSVILGSVTSSLGSITDVESAEQAIPQLSVASEKLGGLVNMVNKLPDAARTPIQQIISGDVPQIQAMVDKVSAIPGVGPVIQPVVDTLLEKLALFE